MKLLQCIWSQTHHNLRNRHNFIVPFCRLESYRRSFFPRCLLQWNNLNDSTKDKPTLEAFKTSFLRHRDPMNELLYYGSRWPSVHHSRIRIGCSKLNSDLCHNLHVIPSPRCPCGWETEDSIHFFFHCPLFNPSRMHMMQTLHNIDNIDINLNTVLWGDPNLEKEDNERVFDAVHTFIVDTVRFD